jgi:hypothetical protein
MDEEIEKPSMLAQQPAEIQALIFSYATLTDIKSISITCQYYRLNVWALIVTLDPASLSNMVAQAADIASSAYIDDLFSEPDPRLVEVSKVQRMPIFHKIFEQVNLSHRKFDTFVLHATDGFEDVKEDFFRGLELYPSFIQQITSLTAIDVKVQDLVRFLKLTPHVRHLDWQVHNKNFPYNLQRAKLPPITSLVLRKCHCQLWNFLLHLSFDLPSLISLDLVDCVFRTQRFHFIKLNSSLERVGFLNSKFMPSSTDSSPITLMLLNALRFELPQLKVLDLRGSVAVTQFCNVWTVKQEFPNVEIVLGPYTRHDTAIELQYSLFTCEPQQ